MVMEETWTEKNLIGFVRIVLFPKVSILVQTASRILLLAISKFTLQYPEVEDSMVIVNESSGIDLCIV